MKPLHAQISDYVMTNIASGEWPVGHLLPTEMELCEQFGVSRASVRTALLHLVNDGYLVRVKGRGTFVTMPQRVEDSTVFIDSFAEEMHRRGQDTQTEVLEFRVMQADEKIRSYLDLPEGSSVIKLTRLRYTKNSFDEGPIVLTTSYYTMKLSFFQNYDFTVTSVRQAMLENGTAKKFTEKRIDAAVLDGRRSRLLGVKAGSLAVVITSYVRDVDDDLVEYCESYYPASRNAFILKIRL